MMTSLQTSRASLAAVRMSDERLRKAIYRAWERGQEARHDRLAAEARRRGWIVRLGRCY